MREADARRDPDEVPIHALPGGAGGGFNVENPHSEGAKDRSKTGDAVMIIELGGRGTVLLGFGYRRSAPLLGHCRWRSG
jgi:hypothetical protein